MRFTTRVLLVHLATVAAVVGVCTAVFVGIAVQQLRAGAEASALGIARTVAEHADVRAGVARFSADPGPRDAAALRRGPLQEIATDVAARTGALFVVVTDDHGIRLGHPDPDRLGRQVSTPHQQTLAGNEVVSWETGTLGESARAKVPVYPPGGGAPVGQVSVGFEPESVFDELPALLSAIAIAAVAATALAALAGLLLHRRWERLTLGVQPEELVALVQHQKAVLDGVGEGVVALDTAGVVRVCNEAATRMLGVADPLGRRLDELGLPDEAVTAIGSGLARDGIPVGDRVLHADVRPVMRAGRPLGDVVVVRDRTDLLALADRLATVRAMTGALRVQRHEFANRLHVAAGLIDAGRVPEAREFLARLQARGPIDFDVEGMAALDEPFLQAFLGAKAIELADRGITLRIDAETSVRGAVREAEDVAAVLGNLIDNAATAAAAGNAPRRVGVTLLDDGAALVATVTDSGRGLAVDDPFAPRGAPGEGTDTPDGDPRPPGHGGDDDVATARRDSAGGPRDRASAEGPRAHAAGRGPRDRVHGHGVGLRLSRGLARRRGGDVWTIDAGGVHHGAVFGMRLPGVLHTPTSGEARAR